MSDTDTKQTYEFKEVEKATLEYFNGDKMATSTWIDKYAMRDQDGELIEKTPVDMHRRMAREFARIEKKYEKKSKDNPMRGLSEHWKKREPLSEERLCELFGNFKYIIPQGSVMQCLGNPNFIGSLSNCVVTAPTLDSYGGICYTDQQLVHLFKRRCGAGIDISNLRPSGINVSNAAGSTTGAVSFMERFSNTTREVAQHGRRGALMISLDVRHPEAEEFTLIKQDLTKVTGANISLKLSDEFMKAVADDKEYTHKFPIDSEEPKYTKTIKAKDLWNTIVQCAWKTAEPGVMFWDRHHWYSPSSIYPQYKNASTNPCLTGETLVSVADGRNAVSISDLAKENKVFPVYTIKDQRVTISDATAFKTGHKKVLKVTLDDGSSFRCTPDHKIMLRNGKYLEASKLKEGQSVMPFNSYVSNNRYRQIDDLRAAASNHKIVSISEDGKEDVYDINVPETHNFGIITSSKDERHLTSSGIFVHNCSEISMGFSDSCRLTAINLFSFVENPFTDKARFDYDKFFEVVYEAQRVMDDLVDLELEAVKKIIEKVKDDPEPDDIKFVEIDTWKRLYKTGEEGRRTGLGFTALADTLAALGLKFDSDEALRKTKRIMKIKCHAEFESSIDMAIERGKFVGFDAKIEEQSEFVKMIKRELPELHARMCRHGRRNVSISTVAPTGSVSILCQTSSGIEPVYELTYKRRKKINPNDKNAQVDFIDDSGDKWQEFEVHHPKLDMWMKITGETDIKKSPYWGAAAMDIDWNKRISLQAAIQQYTSHSISSTINLPSDVDPSTVSKIYTEAWKQGLKGITVYRDGARSGVLISSDTKEDGDFKETSAPRRPKRLDTEVLRFNNDKERWICLVGLYKGRPYEIFTGKAENFVIPNSVERGEIVREKVDGKSRYDFVYKEKNGVDITVESLSSSFNPEFWNYAKLISGVLRHGMPLTYVLDLIANMNLGADHLNTWKAGIARMIKKFIPDGTRAKDRVCPQCGDPDGLIYKEGCLECKSCGKGKCG